MLFFKPYTKEEITVFKTVKQYFEKIPPIDSDGFENAFHEIVAQNIDGGSEYFVVGDLFDNAIIAQVKKTFKQFTSSYKKRIVEHCESFMEYIQYDVTGKQVHDYKEIYNIISNRYKAWIDDTFDVRFLENGYIDKEKYSEDDYEDNYITTINAMVKFTFDYNVFLKSVKLANKTISNRKGSSSTNTILAITSENKESCCLSNGDFNHFINAKIEGEGSISIPIHSLLKLLPMYKGTQVFTIETISDTESIINGGLKVNTKNNFNTKELNNSIVSMKELPKYHETFIPILETLKTGKPIRSRELTVKVRDNYYFDLPKNLLSEKLKSGGNVLLNRVNWGKSYLKMGKFAFYPKRGYVQITEKGKEALKSGYLTLEDLKNDEDFKKHKASEKNIYEEDIELETERVENVSPEDLIETGVSIIEDAVKAEVLDMLAEIDLYIFEKVINKLLRSMGYGDFVESSNISNSSIDGVINKDKLGLEKIYIQARRLNDNKVSERDIRNFIGSMSSDSTKGVFFTTSSFDNSAIKKASEAHHTIVLVDGEKLVDLMYEYNVGIQTKSVYEIKELDNDFFEGE